MSHRPCKEKKPDSRARRNCTRPALQPQQRAGAKALVSVRPNQEAHSPAGRQGLKAERAGRAHRAMSSSSAARSRPCPQGPRVRRCAPRPTPRAQAGVDARWERLPSPLGSRFSPWRPNQEPAFLYPAFPPSSVGRVMRALCEHFTTASGHIFTQSSRDTIKLLLSWSPFEMRTCGSQRPRPQSQSMAGPTPGPRTVESHGQLRGKSGTNPGGNFFRGTRAVTRTTPARRPPPGSSRPASRDESRK